MNKLSLVILLSLISSSLFAKPLFTSILSKSDNEVFVALKDESGKNPTPQIVIMNKDNLKKETLTLSDKIKGREVPAMFYHHDKLYILSQWTIGTGDKPRLDVLNLENKTWNKLGVFSCESFSKIQFKNKRVELQCESGKISVIEVAGLQIAIEREVTLPQSKLKADSGEALSLEGLPYYWRKLKSVNGTTKKIQVMSSSEFY